jgi:transcriptional regulator with XRE-family HTH domain
LNRFVLFLLQNHIIMLVKSVGKTIKERRNALQITQSSLAELAKISLNTLYKIERGEANPTIDIIEKIAEVLGLELKLEAKKIKL